MSDNVMKIALVVILCLVFPREGRVSRIHYKSIELDKLVHVATLIAVVKPVAGGERQQEIRLAKPGDSYYPFQFIVSTMTIVKVLRGEAIAGENVEVYPADFDSQVELHRKYYLEGISKSPIYQKYEPVSRPQEGEQYIVFLRRTKDGHWSFFCLGAGEGLDQLSTITELLKSR